MCWCVSKCVGKYQRVLVCHNMSVCVGVYRCVSKCVGKCWCKWEYATT